MLVFKNNLHNKLGVGWGEQSILGKHNLPGNIFYTQFKCEKIGTSFHSNVWAKLTLSCRFNEETCVVWEDKIFHEQIRSSIDNELNVHEKKSHGVLQSHINLKNLSINNTANLF